VVAITYDGMELKNMKWQKSWINKKSKLGKIMA